MPTIRLPIKCSTAKKCDNALDAAINGAFNLMDGAFNFCAETKVIRWGIILAVGAVVAYFVSLIFYWFGGIIVGSAIATITGSGKGTISPDDWFFVWGGYIAVPLGWLLIGYASGFLKFECIKEPESRSEAEENAALVDRVKWA